MKIWEKWSVWCCVAPAPCSLGCAQEAHTNVEFSTCMGHRGQQYVGVYGVGTDPWTQHKRGDKRLSGSLGDASTMLDVRTRAWTSLTRLPPRHRRPPMLCRHIHRRGRPATCRCCVHIAMRVDVWTPHCDDLRWRWGGGGVMPGALTLHTKIPNHHFNTTPDSEAPSARQ